MARRGNKRPQKRIFKGGIPSYTSRIVAGASHDNRGPEIVEPFLECFSNVLNLYGGSLLLPVIWQPHWPSS